MTVRSAFLLRERVRGLISSLIIIFRLKLEVILENNEWNDTLAYEGIADGRKFLSGKRISSEKRAIRWDGSQLVWEQRWRQSGEIWRQMISKLSCVLV